MLRTPRTVPGETEVLWRADTTRFPGYKARTLYRIKITHRPKIPLMFVKIYEGDTLIVDSGPVVDSSDILTGGRVGLISHISYLIS